MNAMNAIPTYLFHSSWEVCNKVGGIYTVLASSSASLKQQMGDRLIYIGPDFNTASDASEFVEDSSLYADFVKKAAKKYNLMLRVGRWNIQSSPVAILVDFSSMYAEKDQLYKEMWDNYQVDSLHSYGDYDESCMFALMVAKTIMAFSEIVAKKSDRIVYHAHEWMLGMSVLYLKQHAPKIATVFTTHATSIGRSIAGNNKPLYEYFTGYNGDQMAYELNMQSKHSLEKQTAINADCFTTVSELTGKECAQLLDKPADVITVNGFDMDIVPKGAALTRKRTAARKAVLKMANALTGESYPEDTLIVGISGRNEFKNKGIDLFLEALARLKGMNPGGKVIGLLTIPAWKIGPRQDLMDRMAQKCEFDTPLQDPFLTHDIHSMNWDRIVGTVRTLGFDRACNSSVSTIFVPSYLDGNDGILNLSYYDLLPAADLTVYPSYYEPWGYTPLESVAFHIPTITSNLAGFGLWALDEMKDNSLLSGVRVISRGDYNFAEAAQQVADEIKAYKEMPKEQVQKARRAASALSKKAQWCDFVKNYNKAYEIALERALEREKV